LVWDHFRARPLVPVSLFHDRNFAIMNWVAGALTFGMIGMFLPLTIYLQSALGFSAIKAGLTLVPMSLVSMVVAANAGRLANRLVASLHAQAVSYAPQLPPQVRHPFVEGFSSTAGGGLEVGRRSSSAAGQNLANLPPQAQHQIAQVAHDVFLYGFIYAMRP